MTIFLELIAFLCAGVLTGLLSSLFGLGGGLVVVPVSFLIFSLLGYPIDIVMHVALGTSLAVMIITTSNGIIHHARAGNVIKNVIWPMMLPIGLGAVIGALSSTYIHSEWLRYCFMAFLVLVIVNALFNKAFRGDFSRDDLVSFHPLMRTLVAFVIGLVSVLLGIGGSLMSVPYFRKHKMPIANASACALCLTPAIAILGTLGYLYAGWQTTGLPAYSLGFINLPAAATIALGTFIGVPLGIRCLRHLPDKSAAKLYIVMLVIMLVLMVA